MKKITFLILGCVSCGIAAAQPAYSLQQLKDSARQHNIALRTARLDIEAARQQRKEAFTKYFPNVSGTGAWFNANKGMAEMSVNPSEVMPSSLTTLAQMLPAEALAALNSPIGISMMKNGTIAGITAMQPVFAGGQIVNGNRLAKVGEEVSRLQLRLSENEVELQTEQYYWQLVSLQEKMKTIAVVDTLLSDIHKDVSVAVRAGVAMRNDLLQVELRQNETESQRLKLQNGIEVVSLLLAQYCGLSTPFRLGDDWELKERNADSRMLPQTPDFQDGVTSLPEYQLLQKQVEATSLQRKITLGQHLPTVAVGAGYNYHNLLDNNHAFGMIFATVSVPVSDWWSGSHALKRRKLEQQKAEEQLADNTELLRIRMRNAYHDVVEAQQQIGLARRSIEQAQENLRLHRDYYRAGTSKMSDLLEAQLLYQQSRDKFTDAYISYAVSLLKYRQSIGQ